MRYLILFFTSIAAITTINGQIICYSDTTSGYANKVINLPILRGEATLEWKDYKIVIGGKYLDTTAPDSMGVYNCDMYMVDYKNKIRYTLPIGDFPPGTIDQFSGTHYCYTIDKDTAYIMGGYGYDLASGLETTFPIMTIFPIRGLIDSIVQRKPFQELFEVLYDPNFAVTKGSMVRIVNYFWIYNGQQIKAWRDEFTDELVHQKSNYQGQLRTFTLMNSPVYRKVNNIRICTTSDIFYHCVPPKMSSAPVKEW
jgi:hypothetical protein